MTDLEKQSVEGAVSPSHYKVGGIEVRDIWKSKLTKEELGGAYKANIMKYICRAGYKTDSALQDYKKAQQYLTWLIELYEEG